MEIQEKGINFLKNQEKGINWTCVLSSESVCSELSKRREKKNQKRGGEFC